MHDNHKQIERAVIGLVATAISLQILATVLPLVVPYVVVLGVVFVVVRWTLFHTRKW